MRKLFGWIFALLIPFTFFAVIATFLFTLLFASMSSAGNCDKNGMPIGCRDIDYLLPQVHNDLNTKLAAGPGFVGMMGSVSGTTGPVYTDCSQVGTAQFAWFGDYTGDTDKGCIGSTPTDGTVTGATFFASGTDPGTVSPTSGGNVAKIDASGEKVAWPITSKNIFDGSEGRFSFDIYATTTTTQVYLVMGYKDPNNNIQARINATGNIRCDHFGNATRVYADSTATVSDATWTNVQCRWSVATGKVGVKVGAAAWVDTTGTVTAFTAEPSSFDITASAAPDVVYIDNLFTYTASGY